MFKQQIYKVNGKIVRQPRSYTVWILLGLVAMSVFSLYVTEFDFQLLWRNGKNFFNILKGMVPPDWEFFNKIVSPMLETIQMSILGAFLGAVLSVPFSMLAATNITRNYWINGFFKLVLSILRTLPTLVTALLATFIFGIGATAGTVAVFIFSLAYVGKLMYEHIENVDMGPFEAMESMGLSRWEAFRYAIVPQLLPTFLSISLFNFEGNIRYSAVLGYVGAGGIGQLMNTHISFRNYPAVGMILLALMGVVFIIEQISEYFRARLS